MTIGFHRGLKAKRKRSVSIPQSQLQQANSRESVPSISRFDKRPKSIESGPYRSLPVRSSVLRLDRSDKLLGKVPTNRLPAKRSLSISLSLTTSPGKEPERNEVSCAGKWTPFNIEISPTCKSGKLELNKINKSRDTINSLD